jgi:hypothetical protein
MTAQLEVIVQRRHAGQATQPLEGLPLTLQSYDGVGAVRGESRVGPGLLQDDTLLRAGVHPRVQAAPVGEVQRVLDPVRQVGDGRAPALGEVGFEERGQPHPLRDLECAPPRLCVSHTRERPHRPPGAWPMFTTRAQAGGASGT